VEHGRKEVKSLTEEIDEKLRSESLTAENRAKLQAKWDELKRQEKEYLEKEHQLAEEEKLQPWNVDTIGREVWSKSIINKEKKSEQYVESQTDAAVRFIEENEQLLDRLQGVKSTDELEKFLLAYPHMSSDFSSTYLTMRALQMAIDEQWSELERLAKASVYLQYIYEFARGTGRLSKHADVDVIRMFGRGFRENVEMMAAFEKEVQEFVGRLSRRAREKVEEADAEERQKRISQSPGGLDPLEVLVSLPEEMKKAFEIRDKDMISQLALTMDPELFSHHLQRCIDSGLWIP